MFGNWYFGSYQVVKFLRLMRLMRMHLGFTRAGLHVGSVLGRGRPERWQELCSEGRAEGCLKGFGVFERFLQVLLEGFEGIWKVPEWYLYIYMYTVYVYINIMTVFEVEWFCFWKFRKVQEGSVVPQAFGRFQRCLKAVWLKDYISSQSFKKLWKVLKGSKQFWRQGWEVLKTVGDTTWACLLWAWLTALLTRPKAMSPLLWLVRGVGPLPFSWRWSTLSSCWQGY